MKPLSIRFRLTVWYFVVLIATLAVFGVLALYAMQKGIENTVDESLRDEAQGIEQLILGVSPEQSQGLEEELREHSELRAEGDFSQISDSSGHWIYRSQLMAHYDVPLPSTGSHSVYNLDAEGLPLRILVRHITMEGGAYRIQVAAPMDDFYDALSHFKWLLLLLSPILLVLASAGGYWMSRRALAPVDAITREAHEINARNLSKRLIVTKTGDELQRLSETLNAMLERLEAAFNRITQFTADASHELRTPLALMRTITEVSLRASDSVLKYREAQAQILEELEKTSVLVEKLMLLARGDAGAEVLERRHLNLTDTLREACNEGRILAKAKELNFQENVTVNGPLVLEGDSHALHRLFLVLIDNAVKYTPPGGSVTISLTKSEGSALAEFRDTGNGISAEDLPHIFERFYRADKARSREFGGVGLGLSIAQWVVEAHGGSIGVQSAPGSGSIFQVRLPLLDV
jgi:heavy metal sensor kinase